jgi:hypothetical protein
MFHPLLRLAVADRPSDSASYFEHFLAGRTPWRSKQQIAAIFYQPHGSSIATFRWPFCATVEAHVFVRAPGHFSLKGRGLSLTHTLLILGALAIRSVAADARAESLELARRLKSLAAF